MLFPRGMMRIGFGQHNLNLRHRDHRGEADEEQEKRSENAERADESPDIDPSGEEESPCRWEKVAMQAADDDDETLEPHAGVNAHANEVDDEDVVAAPLEPEKLRRKRVAEEHADPPVPPVGPEYPVIKREALVLIPAVPSNEEFHRVGIGHNRTGQQDDLGHLVDVLWRDD